jgi:hypothetical protein
MVGWAFHPSETARANTENARDRIESGSSTGALAGFVAEDSTQEILDRPPRNLKKVAAMF